MRLCASESSPPPPLYLPHPPPLSQRHHPPPPPNLPILPLPFDGADICISNTFMGCQVLVGYRTLGAPFLYSMSDAVFTYIMLFPPETQVGMKPIGSETSRL